MRSLIGDAVQNIVLFVRIRMAQFSGFFREVFDVLKHFGELMGFHD